MDIYIHIYAQYVNTTSWIFFFNVFSVDKSVCTVSIKTWVQISSTKIKNWMWLVLVPVTPALLEAWEDRIFRLAGCQPSSRVRERPCLKRISQIISRILNVFLWPLCMCMGARTQTFMNILHIYIQIQTNKQITHLSLSHGARDRNLWPYAFNSGTLLFSHNSSPQN